MTSIFNLLIVFSALLIAMTGCTTWTPEQREQFSRAMNAQAQQSQQQAQRDQASAEEDISRIGSHKINVPPMKGSNGYSETDNKRQKASEPQLPSGLGGHRTGQIKYAPDGTLYYEMKDSNGAVYWTNSPQ